MKENDKKIINSLLPRQTLGIIGYDSQARFLAQSAGDLGYQVGLLSREKYSPAGQYASWEMCSPDFDAYTLKRFAERCHMVIFDPLELDSDTIKQIETLTQVPQGSYIAALVQDRLIERAYLDSQKINIAPYAIVYTLADIRLATEELGFPCVLKPVRKTKHTNDFVTLYSAEDFFKLHHLLDGKPYILETIVPYDKCIHVSAARNGKGALSIFPTTEVVYREDNTWQMSIAPARLSNELQVEIKSLVLHVMTDLQVLGLMHFEIFVTASGLLFVNALMCYPTDSLTYTKSWQSMSQYAAHIRGICQLPLETIRLPHDYQVSVGILEKDLHKANTQLLLMPNWHFCYLSSSFLLENNLAAIVSSTSKELDTLLDSFVLKDFINKKA